MKVHEDKARKLLLALGYPNAMKYGTQMVVSRLTEMEANVKDDVRMGVKDAGLKKLMNTIIRAVKIGDKVELIDPLETQRNKAVETFGKKMEREQNERAEKEVLPKPRKVGQVPDEGNPEVVMAPAQTEEAENALKPAVTEPPGVGRARELLLKRAQEKAKQMAEEDDRKAAAAKPKRTSKDEWPDLVLTEKTPPGPGTIERAIFNILSDASEKKPVSKDEVADRLAEEFPDKPKKNLRWNVDGFPHWLPKKFPFSVHQRDKRYWIAPKKELR